MQRLAHAQTVRGQIDAVDPTGNVRGWCAAEAPPFGPRRVSVLIGGARALTGIACDQFRMDLLAAGLGDGRHGFSADLPPALLVHGQTSAVALQDEDTGATLGDPMLVKWAIRPIEAPALEAHVDAIRSDGLITGWCWDPGDPTRQVVLDVSAAGVHAGTAIAGLFRDDLRHAGKGSGHCAFNFFLPWGLIATSPRIEVTLRDTVTGQPVGEPMVLRRPQLASADRRIDALERQLQLLRAEQEAAERRPASGGAGGTNSDLFRVIGSFFQDVALGRLPAERASLSSRVEEASARLPLVQLTLCEAAEATIFILPDGSIDRLHACCAALHRAAADMRARIVVLDGLPPGGDDAVLIPAVVRNLQIHHVRPDETVNDALRGAETDLLVLLPAGIGIGPDWLNRLLALLAADPGAAMAVGALSIDGAPASPHVLTAHPDGGLRADPPGAVDAVDRLGVVLRTKCLRDLGGLDLSYSNLAAQILEFCLRLRGRGLRIAADPGALGYCVAQESALLDQASPEDVRRLRAVCEGLPPPAPAPGRRRGKTQLRPPASVA